MQTQGQKEEQKKEDHWLTDNQPDHRPRPDEEMQKDWEKLMTKKEERTELHYGQKRKQEEGQSRNMVEMKQE